MEETTPPVTNTYFVCFAMALFLGVASALGGGALPVRAAVGARFFARAAPLAGGDLCEPNHRSVR